VTFPREAQQGCGGAIDFQNDAVLIHDEIAKGRGDEQVEIISGTLFGFLRHNAQPLPSVPMGRGNLRFVFASLTIPGLGGFPPGSRNQTANRFRLSVAG
jgi:hypothetical protein